MVQNELADGFWIFSISFDVILIFSAAVDVVPQLGLFDDFGFAGDGSAHSRQFLINYCWYLSREANYSFDRTATVPSIRTSILSTALLHSGTRIRP
jgi:hypothetical protein